MTVAKDAPRPRMELAARQSRSGQHDEAVKTLLGLALGMVQPMVMAALHQLIAPRLHGSAIGLRMMVLNVSSTVMPMLFGVGGAVVGAAHLFWLIAFITGSGSLLVKRLSSDLRRAEHNPPD